jgi:hypothetical protein
VGIEDVLDPDHFLGLKPQRLTIFEDERDERPNGNPASLLERDDLRAELLPLALIVSHGQQISLYEFLHRSCRFRLNFAFPSRITRHASRF